MAHPVECSIWPKGHRAISNYRRYRFGLLGLIAHAHCLHFIERSGMVLMSHIREASKVTVNSSYFHPAHQHYTDEAHKAETVPSVVFVLEVRNVKLQWLPFLISTIKNCCRHHSPCIIKLPNENVRIHKKKCIAIWIENIQSYYRYTPT
jgi:hypothetical protein